MAIHDLTKKTRASTGQKITLLGPADNTMRVIKLEKRLDSQEQKLDKGQGGPKGPFGAQTQISIHC